MQQRPHLGAVLAAIKSFLEDEVEPAVRDQNLRYRMRVASRLMDMAAAELGHEDRLMNREIAELRELLGIEAPASEVVDRTARRRVLTSLRRELAFQIRGGVFDEGGIEQVHDHLLGILSATLSATNPHFDLSMTDFDIEAEP